jgi:hypothetical protein
MRLPRFALVLSLTLASALCAQEEDPVARQRAVNILSYQRLAEMQKKPELVKAVKVIAERFPDFFSDGPLVLLVTTAVASTKTLPPGVTKEAIVQARAQLQVKGRFEMLKDKELRESLIEVLWNAKMPAQIFKYADEATSQFRGAKESALGRACIANMKVLTGGMEMYALDKNRPPPVASTDQLMSELTSGGYIQKPIQFCALDKVTPLVFTPAVSSATVRCPTHGDPQNASLAGGEAKSAMEKAAETNPVVWATMQTLK